MPHIMIVVSPYYKDVSEHLLSGTKAALDKYKATYETYEAAGALEIPLALKYGMGREARRGVDSPKFDGYIALGCVIRGETSHYDIVCNESARALMQLSLDRDVPIGNAILTCDTHDQAIKRADPSQGNKGSDAVEAVMSLLGVRRSLHQKVKRAG